jgi:hypothetical protein
LREIIDHFHGPKITLYKNLIRIKLVSASNWIFKKHFSIREQIKKVTRQPLNEKGFCTKKNILEVFSGVQYVVRIFKLKFELGFIWNM